MFKPVLTAALLLAAPAAFAQQGTPGTHFIENWDMDADGVVSLEEVQERRGIVFDMFDDDQNGQLNAAEYAIFDETRAADMEQNAGGHGNGQGQGQGQGGDRMNEGMTMAFNDTDGDGDGEVSKEEFLARASDWFMMMDRNGDGAVTTDDFGRR